MNKNMDKKKCKRARKGTDPSSLEDSLRLRQSLFCSSAWAVPSFWSVGVWVIAAIFSLSISTFAAGEMPPRVLLIWDEEVEGTFALRDTLLNAGVDVVLSDTNEVQYDGTNPSLDTFDSVIHLNGTTFAQQMTADGQRALAEYVTDGGGYIGSERNSYEVDAGRMQIMRDLVLLDYSGTTWGATDLSVVEDDYDHPVLAGIPDEFTFWAGGVSRGSVHQFVEDPATVLMRDFNGNDAVSVREFAFGRVVGFHHAGNYDRFAYGYNPLLDPNILQLYVNSVFWTSRFGEKQPIAKDVTFRTDADAAPGTVLGTLPAWSPTGESLAFNIVSGDESGIFVIDPFSGELSLAASPGVRTHKLIVEVTTPSNYSDTQEVTVLTRSPGRSILLIWDSMVEGTLAVRQALEDVGFVVTFSETSELQYDGSNPSPEEFDAVVHFNGSTYKGQMQYSGQYALVDYVRNGGAFIGTERSAYEIKNGRMLPMRDLVLVDHLGTGFNSVTMSAVEGAEDHAVIENVPSSFTFPVGVYSKTRLHYFEQEPATVLMRDSKGYDAVTVREFGQGRIVYFHLASNTAQNGALRNANILQLFTDAVIWAKEGLGNRPPEIEDASFSVEENCELGSLLGTVTASDPDDELLLFRILPGGHDGEFHIDAESGEITVAGKLDYEGKPSYNLEVEVLDVGSLTATAIVTINLIDVNEAPVIDKADYSISEDTVMPFTLGVLNATDQDAGDTVRFEIVSGNDDSVFTLDPSTGALAVVAALDFEFVSSYSLTVQAADAAGLVDLGSVLVSVENINEAPVIEDAGFVVDENAPIGTLVGQVTYSDPEDDDLRFSLTSGNTGQKFHIDHLGVIRVAGPIDFERTSGFVMEVKALDDGGLFDVAQVVVNVNDVNLSPVANAGEDQVVERGFMTILDGTGSYDDGEDTGKLLFAWRFVEVPETSQLANENIDVLTDPVMPSFTPDVLGDFVLELTVFDEKYSDTDQVVISSDAGPAVVEDSLQASPNPVPLYTGSESSLVVLTATLDDTYTRGSAVIGAEFRIDDEVDEYGIPVWYELYPVDEAWGEVVEEVNASFTLNLVGIDEPGVYSISFRGIDAYGFAGEESSTMLVVYDSSGGFVTGGGWVWSAPGAYALDPDAEGKANFGFVAKYKRGATKPTGNTEFNFSAGGFNFHSKDQDWLVVAGSKAILKGTGTVNDLGMFKFMITAIDGDGKGGKKDDSFQIRIWSEEQNGQEFVIYDSQRGDDSSTLLGGGSIIIHKK